MALQINCDLSIGVSADYWRIITIRSDYISREIIVDLALYLNKATRDCGKDPLEVNTFKLNSELLLQCGYSRADIYELLKELPEFQGAQDL